MTETLNLDFSMELGWMDEQMQWNDDGRADSAISGGIVGPRVTYSLRDRVKYGKDTASAAWICRWKVETWMLEPRRRLGGRISGPCQLIMGCRSPGN